MDSPPDSRRELRLDLPLVEKALRLGSVGLYLQDFVTGEHVWSPETYELFGVGPEFELNAESLMRVILPDDQPHVLRQANAAHAGDPSVNSYVVEFRARGEDGEVRRLEARGWLERDESGAVLRERGTVRDVGELHALRTQLVHSQREELLGKLAGGIAHDFNNLLTVILGQASLIELQIRGGHMPEAHDLEIIKDASQRGAALTQRLLRFAGDRRASAAMYDLNDLIGRAEQVVKRMVGEDRELVFELAQDLPPALMDPAQLEQVLLNLVINARDATGPGDRILVRTRADQITNAPANSRMASGPSVALEVTDSGVGMSEETRAQACDAFYTTKAHGTGLGLATCKVIVEERQGLLELDSSPGNGTTVSIRLPADPHAKACSLDGPLVDALALGEGKRVLLAEDEPMVRALSERALRGFGFEVIVAENGAEALRRATEHPIDFVVSDIVLPGDTSPQDLRAGLAERLPGVPVLFVSGYAVLEGDAVVGDLLQPGDAFLAKPYTPVTLASKMREMLSRGGGVVDGA